jgi:hypothetical protein
VDAFVSGAGTGGTIAGVSAFLKSQRAGIRVFLVDPPGSSLYNKVERGVLYARVEAEGTRLKHPFDTITEGIGLNRLTANFAAASIDGAFQGTDREAVEMAAHLLRWGPPAAVPPLGQGACRRGFARAGLCGTRRNEFMPQHPHETPAPWLIRPSTCPPPHPSPRTGRTACGWAAAPP